MGDGTKVLVTNITAPKTAAIAILLANWRNLSPQDYLKAST